MLSYSHYRREYTVATTEFTTESWRDELGKKLRPGQLINGEFFQAYKNYIFEWGASKIVKGAGHAEHARRRDAAAQEMRFLNPSFELRRATGRANTLYNDWSKRASANSRSKAAQAEKKRPKTDMGGEGGTDALSHERGGSSRKSRGRREN